MQSIVVCLSVCLSVSQESVTKKTDYRKLEFDKLYSYNTSYSYNTVFSGLCSHNSQLGSVVTNLFHVQALVVYDTRCDRVRYDPLTHSRHNGEV